VKQNKCIHHDMKNEKCQKMESAECSDRKDSPIRNRSHFFSFVALRVIRVIQMCKIGCAEIQHTLLKEKI
jgi:hypothetical protein